MKRKFSYIVKSMLSSPIYVISSALLTVAMLVGEGELIVLVSAIILLTFTYLYAEEFGKVYDEKVALELRISKWLDVKTATRRNCGEK